jgi:hypothetical protein
MERMVNPLLVSTILDMERLPELAPEFTVSLADFKSALKLLKISATTVWDGELMISFDGTVCALS